MAHSARVTRACPYHGERTGEQEQQQRDSVAETRAYTTKLARTAPTSRVRTHADNEARSSRPPTLERVSTAFLRVGVHGAVTSFATSSARSTAGPRSDAERMALRDPSTS